VERWAAISGVSMAFFGVALVAIGAEIPDTIQSVTVARRGYGSMAVSNCQGSQITNISLGLGLPWFLSNLSGRQVILPDYRQIRKAALLQGCNVTLNAIILLMVACVTGTNKAILSKSKGVILLCAYGVALGIYAAIVFCDCL